MSVREEHLDPLLADLARLRQELARARDERDRLAAELCRARATEIVEREERVRIDELRAALTMIGGYGRLLLRRIETGDTTLREPLERLCRAADWGAGWGAPRPVHLRPERWAGALVNVNAVVSAIEPMLRRLLDGTHDLALDLEPDLDAVRGEADQVEHLLVTLVMSARQASPGGRVTITTADVAVEPQRRAPPVPAGRYVLLAVSEAPGAGPPRRPEPAGGTDLAWTARRLGVTAAMDLVGDGGCLRLDTDPTRGWTFELYLPRAGAPEPAACGRGSAGAAGRETVLVVEDEPQVRDLIRDVLALHGYTVLTADDGAEALAVGERYPGRIDLLLLDVVLPRVPADEVVRCLAARRPGIKVVYMSGYTDDLIQQHGLLRVGRDFLQKPFTVDALARKVREVLDEPA